MQIPNSFKKAIKNAFYDKDIMLLSAIPSRDSHGGSSVEFVDSESFEGNVNFSVAKEIQEEYGLDQKIDIVITTGFKVDKDSYIRYLDTIYKVSDNVFRDSHYRLVGVKNGH